MREDRILLSHGSGGMLSMRLIHDVFKDAFSNLILEKGDDAAEISLDGEKRQFAFTTDSYVVNPIFFPGGDIGRLSVCGTVNDLSMKGARPLWISASFILEEGFKLDMLRSIVNSMGKAAEEAGVLIVTGDTKVVEKGKADGIFITTSGVGEIQNSCDISGGNAKPGDVVLISGTIGDHGISVMSARNNFGLKGNFHSDCAPLNKLVSDIIRYEIHVLRDPTRGGLASSLNEIAIQSDVQIQIEEEFIPVRDEVKSFCNILGIDPLYVANEGKLIAIVPRREMERVLEVMWENPLGREAKYIGEILEPKPQGVFLITKIGGKRPLLMLEGEILPRIC